MTLKVSIATAIQIARGQKVAQEIQVTYARRHCRPTPLPKPKCKEI